MRRRSDVRGDRAGATDFAGIVRGLKPAYPLTFLGMRVVLGAAALLAAYLPTRRARRVNPVAALRID